MKWHYVLLVALALGVRPCSAEPAHAPDATNPCSLMSMEARDGRVYMLAGEDSRWTALISREASQDAPSGDGIVRHSSIPGLTNQGYRGTPFVWTVRDGNLRFLSVVDLQELISDVASVADAPIAELPRYLDIEEGQPTLLPLVPPTRYVVARRIEPFLKPLIVNPGTSERVRNTFLFAATLRPDDHARLYLIEEGALTAHSGEVGTEPNEQHAAPPVVEWNEEFNIPSPIDQPFMAIPVDAVDVLLTIDGRAFRVLDDGVRELGRFEPWLEDMQTGEPRIIVLQREDGRPTVLDVQGDHAQPIAFKPEDAETDPLFDQSELAPEMQEAVMALVRAARDMDKGRTPESVRQEESEPEKDPEN